MKLADGKSKNTYIDPNTEIDDQHLKFKIGVVMLKYKNIKMFLQKVTLQIDLKKFLWLKNFKIMYREHVINDLNGEQIVWTFHKKELKKTNQKEFRIEKVIKRKGDILYLKRKGYNNLFNSWIDKKDIA